MVLVLDAAYGLALVVLHATLLGKIHGDSLASKESREVDHWFVQLVDLDLSWGHRLMGFDDFACLLSGLLYGVAVITCTTCALGSVTQGAHGSVSVDGSRAEPSLPRWFLVFAHVQLIIYIGQAVAKFPLLCELRRDYFPMLESNCDVLRFAYGERVIVGIAVASLGLWVLGSFSYLGNTDRTQGESGTFAMHEGHQELQRMNYKVSGRYPTVSWGTGKWNPLHQSLPEYAPVAMATPGTTTAGSSFAERYSFAAGSDATSWGLSGVHTPQTRPSFATSEIRLQTRPSLAISNGLP